MDYRQESMVNIAFEILTKSAGAMSFYDIWKEVAEKKFKLTGNNETNVTISLGVATFPSDGDTAPKIIESADKKLYYAKNNGRNQVGK